MVGRGDVNEVSDVCAPGDGLRVLRAGDDEGALGEPGGGVIEEGTEFGLTIGGVGAEIT